MKNILIITIISLFALICGCALKYENVSAGPEYSQLLNTSYSLKTNLYIYGINLPPGYGKDINVYFVRPWRGSGPEYITEDILNPGVTLRVQSIRKSINHIFFCDQVIEAVVEVSPYEKTADVPVTISLKYLQTTNYVNKL